MHFGPDDSKIAAKYWLYMWVDDPGAVIGDGDGGCGVGDSDGPVDVGDLVDG